MTVTYTKEVATCRGISCFLKLLLRWRGSIYKLVWLDFLTYLFVYYSLNLTYRFALGEEGKLTFVSIVKYSKECSSYIPLSFVLGFYVSIVMTRWWNQYTAIPFPDSLAILVSTTIHGQDDRGRAMRRTIMRYVCLCITMLFSNISGKVKRRFPTLEHFVEAGLLERSEREVMIELNKKFPKYSKHWLPLVWASSLVTRARKEGRVRDDFAVKSIIDELNAIRGKCGLLTTYDIISVPLVYTQVVTLAVYGYFLATAVGHQWIEHQGQTIDMYFPFFSSLQFFFYMGWLKVAESLINPFGDNDDDFELNWMVDRNLQVSYLIVDEMHHEHPELIKDQYWDRILPDQLPYTIESEPFRESHPLPSTANIAGQYYEDDGVNDMQSSAITFAAKPRKKYNMLSQNSLANSVQDMTRSTSFSSLMRRFLSRENSRTDSVISDSAHDLGPFKSGSVTKKGKVHTIEEVDEQLTLNSSYPEHRISVMDVFEKPRPSEAIPIPMPTPNNRFSVVNTPIGSPQSPTSDVSSFIFNHGSDPDDHDEDLFVQLQRKREEERLRRIKKSMENYSNDGNKEE